MNSYQKFLSSPGKRSNNHKVYEKQSFFAFPMSPETVHSEAILASLYRQIGLSVAAEEEVPKFSKDFMKEISRERASREAKALKKILEQVFYYPKTPQQSSKRQVNIYPLVPSLANYAAPVRPRGNPWNPGKLIAHVVLAGSKSLDEATEIWKLIFEGLSINEDDDELAKYINKLVNEFHIPDVRSKINPKITPFDLSKLVNEKYKPFCGSMTDFNVPSVQFVKDLKTILNLKKIMTRKEWLVYFESLLRMGVVTHTQWLCKIHDIVWRIMTYSLEGGKLSDSKIQEQITESLQESWWSLGDKRAYAFRLRKSYIRARIGINLLLYKIEEDSPKTYSQIEKESICGVDSLIRFTTIMANWASEYRESKNIQLELRDIFDSNENLINGTKGISNGLKELWAYSLQKKISKMPEDAEFDQGYFLEKKGSYKSAPWIAMLGPVAISFASHACQVNSRFGTIASLQDYFAKYGLKISDNDFKSGVLGRRLRGLGLVVDSPDAESGMSILDPFLEVLDG